MGLLIAAAVALPAASAQAQALESQGPPVAAPVPEEAANLLDQAPGRAEIHIDEATALGPVDPAPTAETPPSAVAPPTATTNDDGEEAQAVEQHPAAEVTGTVEPQRRTAPEPAAEPAPAASPSPPPAASQNVPMPETQTAEENPEVAVESQRPAERRAREPAQRLLSNVDARLRAVERDLRKVRRHVDAGTEPPPQLVVELQHSVQRLLPAVAALERHVAEGGGTLPGLGAIRARLEFARGAAAALVAALRHHPDRSASAEALIEQLAALDLGLPAFAPVDRPGRLARHARHAQGADAVGQPSGVAYTQLHTVPSQPQSGISAAAERSPAGAGKLPEGPQRWPAPPRSPLSGAAAAPSGAFFSIAGPAALALLLGLAIPRVLRRLARLPAGRQPEPFVAPRERPG
jgi:hypothetical protein